MHAHDQTPPAAGPRATNAARCPFSLAAGAVLPSLADVLKERTRDAHTRAERHALQADMVRGSVTREQYAGWLGQMLHVWRALDEGLAALAARDPRVAATVRSYHVHAPRVLADLGFLGCRADDTAVLPATARFVELVHRTSAGPSLVGIWYVLEGSANGGRFIAQALSRGLQIVGPEGLTSFNPHGERQREYWQAWRAALDAQTFDDSERGEIIAAASAAFDAIYDLMDDLRGVDAVRVAD
ncbi:MAG: biliverdin-producing heme oxygenase [Phycisphaerales bacterium]